MFYHCLSLSHLVIQQRLTAHPQSASHRPDSQHFGPYSPYVSHITCRRSPEGSSAYINHGGVGIASHVWETLPQLACSHISVSPAKKGGVCGNSGSPSSVQEIRHARGKEVWKDGVDPLGCASHVSATQGVARFSTCFQSVLEKMVYVCVLAHEWCV